MGIREGEGGTLAGITTANIIDFSDDFKAFYCRSSGPEWNATCDGATPSPEGASACSSPHACGGPPIIAHLPSSAVPLPLRSGRSLPTPSVSDPFSTGCPCLVRPVRLVRLVCPPPLHSKFLPSDAFHAPSIASNHPSSAVNRSVLVVRRETGAVPLHVELISWKFSQRSNRGYAERVHRSQPHRVLCRHLFYARHHAWRDPSVTSFRALLKTRTNSADQI